MKTAEEIQKWFRTYLSILTIGEDEQGNDVLMMGDDRLIDEICSLNRKAMEEYAEQFKQPTAQGWECPRCHKIHSWLHMECDCPPKVMTATTNLQPEITDEDIEEWAKTEVIELAKHKPMSNIYQRALIRERVIGAKAMRDGLIKPQK